MDVGVGRGSIFNEYEYVGYGLRSDDARERMAEAVDIMTRAWTDTPLDHRGRFYTLSLPELRPVPVQKPHPPIWHSVVSAPSFEACGRAGVPILTVRLPTELIGDRLGLYAKGLAESGLDANTQRQRLSSAALWRWIYVGESRAEAEDTFAETLRHTRQHMAHARSAFNPPDFQIPNAMLNPWTDTVVSEEEGIRFAMANGTIIGSLADVTGQIAALHDAGVGHVLAQMSFGYMDHAKIRASMRRFGTEIMPKFK
ncbi:MAG: LLM class flavin-dependent oxidoreductase [Hyphomicrobiaceae bacterium]